MGKINRPAMVGIVRDSKGNIVFNDYENIPDYIYETLTETDKNYIRSVKDGDNPKSICC